jgi:hypothetical protein
MKIEPHPGLAGLCEDCRNAKIVSAKNGSRFYLCQLASGNALFPKYPRLPVLRCAGYTPLPRKPV